MEPIAKSLDGKLALITGGGHGIGAAIAQQLSAMGAISLICGRRREPMEHTQRAIRDQGGRCETAECDITSLSSVERLASSVRADFGAISFLINNAGIGSFSTPLLELPPEEWDAIINTNLRGAYYCIRAFAPMMIQAGSGHIINISSIAGKNAVPKGAAYAASKWGLNGLTYSVAEELRGQNIRVSVVCPGSTLSDLSLPGGKDRNKMLRASDIAHVVAMLATQESQSFVSEVVIRPTMKP